MPLNNFGVVGPSVFRSAQPDAESLDTLRAIGITVVLKLNTREESDSIAGELGPGLILWEWPLALEAPADADTRAIVESIARYVSIGEVVLIHCTHGRDRTGFVVAAYQLLHLRKSLDQALAMRADYGVDDAWHRLFNQSFTDALERLV